MAQDAPTPVKEAVQTALARLDERARGWRESVRQDAAESVARVGWRRQVRGVRVPVRDLFVTPVERAADAVARRFAVALLPGDEDRAARAAAEAAAPLVPPGEADLVIKRGLTEKTVPFRRRFEEAILEHVDSLYADVMRPAFEARLRRIVAALGGGA